MVCQHMNLLPASDISLGFIQLLLRTEIIISNYYCSLALTRWITRQVDKLTWVTPTFPDG